MGTTDRSAADVPAVPRLARFRAPFVWGVWALLSAGLVGYVWLVNDDFPIADDWHLVPSYTGHQPLTLSWLWEQYNEHRMPLPKVLLVLGGAATGYDYRAGLLLSALALSGLAGLMIFAAGRLRGGPSFADVLFPLVLLHWGQYETLLIAYALNLVASTVLAGVALLVMVHAGGRLSLRHGVLFGLCLLLLPLCGSSGAVLVPALALWLAAAAAACWRSGGRRGRAEAVVLLTLALTSVVLTAVYFVSLEPVAGSPPRPTAFQAARTAVEVLAESAGPFAQVSWPLSGLAVVALALATVLKLTRDWRTLPAERLRPEGLFCFGAAMLSLAAGIGWGRGGGGPAAGFATRYATLAAPILCLAYLAWRSAPDRRIAWGLCGVVALLFLFNTGQGITRAQVRRQRMRDLQADVASGLTPAEMAKKWGADIYAANAEADLTERFEMLRRAGQGPYKGTRAARGRED